MNTPVIVLIACVVVSWATSIYLMVRRGMDKAEKARLTIQARNLTEEVDLWRNAWQKTNDKLEKYRTAENMESLKEGRIR